MAIYKFLYVLVLINCVFQGLCPFDLSYRIYRNKFIVSPYGFNDCSLMLPLSFLILVIWVFSLSGSVFLEGY